MKNISFGNIENVWQKFINAIQILFIYRIRVLALVLLVMLACGGVSMASYLLITKGESQTLPPHSATLKLESIKTIEEWQQARMTERERLGI